MSVFHQFKRLLFGEKTRASPVGRPCQGNEIKQIREEDRPPQCTLCIPDLRQAGSKPVLTDTQGGQYELLRRRSSSASEGSQANMAIQTAYHVSKTSDNEQSCDSKDSLPRQIEADATTPRRLDEERLEQLERTFFLGYDAAGGSAVPHSGDSDLREPVKSQRLPHLFPRSPPASVELSSKSQRGSETPVIPEFSHERLLEASSRTAGTHTYFVDEADSHANGHKHHGGIQKLLEPLTPKIDPEAFRPLSKVIATIEHTDKSNGNTLKYTPGGRGIDYACRVSGVDSSTGREDNAGIVTRNLCDRSECRPDTMHGRQKGSKRVLSEFVVQEAHSKQGHRSDRKLRKLASFHKLEDGEAPEEEDARFPRPAVAYTATCIKARAPRHLRFSATTSQPLPSTARELELLHRLAKAGRDKRHREIR